MKLQAITLTLSALILSASLMSQGTVPMRVAVEEYGAASGTTNASNLTLDLDASGKAGARLRVSGGTRGDLGGLLVAKRPATLSLPLGVTLLVAPTAFPIVKIFDRNGEIRQRLDLRTTRLVGSSYCVQAFHLERANRRNPGIVGLHLSRGLKLRFAPGNKQPKSTYSSHPFAATLIRYGKAGASDSRYAILNQVVVPSTGFSLQHDDTQTTGGMTRVYLSLVPPQLRSLPVMQIKRRHVALPPRTAKTIEVWIQGSPNLAVYERAAVIQRSF